MATIADDIDFSNPDSSFVFFNSGQDSRRACFFEDFEPNVRYLCSSLADLFPKLMSLVEVANRSGSDQKRRACHFYLYSYVNLVDSIKLLCDGYFPQSCNTLRVHLESVLTAILLSYQGSLELVVEWKGGKAKRVKQIDYQERLYSKSKAKRLYPMNSFGLCVHNASKLKLDKSNLELLRKVKKHCSGYSHSSFENQTSTFFETGDDLQFGGGYSQHLKKQTETVLAMQIGLAEANTKLFEHIRAQWVK
ncbi:hypothetical protein [uncultured Pseudoteredinibacter sp.]|uniref:hypothetical protein n=1 Tax=uncultured Pseudoteredinibacter sp. TaxID=1641701 RepID=UPI00261EAAD6|nr:hypothetical protein [uncultured Pseudoteredinibacter sp.]